MASKMISVETRRHAGFEAEVEVGSSATSAINVPLTSEGPFVESEPGKKGLTGNVGSLRRVVACRSFDVDGFRRRCRVR